ncbi:hypothetical protein LCGC14_1841310 [marine sediment metagenome]|uniref:Uncharacterized protein n=1 Tax=marine sediment metagenome TaxID=412755 RepID=A0A0F9ISR4_9ZZZZ
MPGRTVGMQPRDVDAEVAAWIRQRAAAEDTTVGVIISRLGRYHQVSKDDPRNMPALKEAGLAPLDL